ncbi:hypothetical protein [Anabaena catenula]|nr:hypothetical protein [Anabaena catenula]
MITIPSPKKEDEERGWIAIAQPPIVGDRSSQSSKNLKCLYRNDFRLLYLNLFCTRIKPEAQL